MLSNGLIVELISLTKTEAQSFHENVENTSRAQIQATGAVQGLEFAEVRPQHTVTGYSL